MLTTLAIVAAIVVVAIAAILIIASTKPNHFRVERSTNIAAPADKIFPLIEDLHENTRWSPFEKDPNMKRTHSGAPKGKGAVYDWDGNRQVGSGRIAITDAVAPSRVAMSLEMYKPFKASNKVEFTLQPSAQGTTVTWAMFGPQPFMAKVMGTLMNCDKMIGSQFEEGLARMKSIAEAA
jgi:uncharacterized protein YndB with AHSA1/START domain